LKLLSIFSVELPKKSPVKNIKSTPASPCAADFYEIWHTRSTHRRNHVCQIFSRSVQGLRSSDAPKLPFPIDLLRRPYNSVALPCDTVIVGCSSDTGGVMEVLGM